MAMAGKSPTCYTMNIAMLTIVKPRTNVKKVFTCSFTIVKQQGIAVVFFLLFLFGLIIPICSMYGIFTNIYPTNHSNVGKYNIHGAYGIC